ncbi:MAG TPA: T9SS type A sorting domain-containing protein [Chitinophagales bacterium]|nr:T9SS type A sorting domain-containing protein [Chitinophagales bacterium]HRG85444.1 T9SS type A sorting domain-containing protein [Chitinophagales bacterium]HRH53057.1 T9SS type A sorting domain-containing protein [Chitinophagales bacterium]
MNPTVFLYPIMKFVKTLLKVKVDWLLLIFFLLLILLPFILFSAPAATPPQPATLPYVMPDEIPAFLVTGEMDTIQEDFPAIYTSRFIALATIPTDTVYVIITPNEEINVGAGIGLVDTLMFTPYAAALIAKEIKIKPYDDTEYEGEHYGVMHFTILTDDPEYATLTITSDSVLILDNDLPPGITTSFPSDTSYTEGLAGFDYLIALTSIPTDTVYITIDPDDQLRITGIPGEPIVLTFEPNASALSYDGASVRAVDDAIYEGLHNGSVTFSITTDAPEYAPFVIPEVVLPIIDNDSMPGINFEIPAILALTEGEGEVAVAIALKSVPTDTVHIQIIPDVQLRITGAPGEAVTLDFAPNTSALSPHIALVKAYDDFLYEGEHIGNVSFVITTTDADYSAFTIEPFDISITDNDLIPGITFEDTTGLIGVENMIDTLHFSVYLNSIPTSTVTINFDPDINLDLGKGKDADVSMKFKEDSSLIARVMNVMIFNDPIVEGPHIGTIVCSITTTDTFYADFTIPNIYVAITDDDGTAIMNYDPDIFQVFPTVTTNTLQYKVDENFANATIRIFSMDGRMTAEHNLVGKTGTLDVQHLNSGTYIIMVSNNEAMFYQRFQVIR